jgi:mono/diheme cytochrome c family protein
MNNRTVLSLAFVFSLILLIAVTKSVSASNPYQGDQIAHGKYIVSIAGCADCHTPYKAEYQDPTQWTPDQIKTIAFNAGDALDQDKRLAGGRPFDLGPLGVLLTRNITPDQATGIGSWADDDIKLAVKTGVEKGGRILFPVMPYHTYNGMADADVDAAIAYLRSVKAVSNQIPESTVSTEGMPSLPYQTGIVAPDPSDKAARGDYLVNHVLSCTDCHTPVDPTTGAPIMDKYLAGGQPYEGPWGIVYGGNITPDKETGLGNWTEDEIKRALTTGVNNKGRRLILMPWFVYSNLSAADADAVAYYIKNVLSAVKNEVPVPSLKPGFEEMAPASEFSGSTNNNLSTSPVIIVVVGVAVILLVSVGIAFLRRRSSKL